MRKGKSPEEFYFPWGGGRILLEREKGVSGRPRISRKKKEEKSGAEINSRISAERIHGLRRRIEEEETAERKQSLFPQKRKKYLQKFSRFSRSLLISFQ